MPDDPLLKIQRVRASDQGKRWEDVPTPDELLTWLMSQMAVDARGLKPFAGLVVTGNVPAPADRGKLWLKTTSPIAIGAFVNGQWQLVYKYPPNTAFLWTAGENALPKDGYIARLSDLEISDLGLPVIAAGKKAFWVEFRPPDDEIISPT